MATAFERCGTTTVLPLVSVVDVRPLADMVSQAGGACKGRDAEHHLLEALPAAGGAATFDIDCAFPDKRDFVRSCSAWPSAAVPRLWAKLFAKGFRLGGWCSVTA